MGSHVLSRVPTEVWCLIEDELRSLSIIRARLQLMEELHCSECADQEFKVDLEEFEDEDVDLEEVVRHTKASIESRRREFHLHHVQLEDWIDHLDLFWSEEECTSGEEGTLVRDWIEVAECTLINKVGPRSCATSHTPG